MNEDKYSQTFPPVLELRLGYSYNMTDSKADMGKMEDSKDLAELKKAKETSQGLVDWKIVRKKLASKRSRWRFTKLSTAVVYTRL